MVARKSIRPSKAAPPPDTTMDVDPTWLTEFAEEEEPTDRRRQPRARTAAPERAATTPAIQPPPRIRALPPTITNKPESTMEVDPAWLESDEFPADEQPTKPKARNSRRPTAKPSQRPLAKPSQKPPPKASQRPPAKSSRKSPPKLPGPTKK